MAMQLHPQNGTHYPDIEAGTIEALVAHLAHELTTTGYSLLPEDVLHAYITETQYYASWATLHCQREATAVILLDKQVALMGYEWAIVDPVVRAHCDLLQARLVEGSRSMGGDGWGLSVSEATQNYIQERDKLLQLAFCEPPFSFKTLGGN